MYVLVIVDIDNAEKSLIYEYRKLKLKSLNIFDKTKIVLLDLLE